MISYLTKVIANLMVAVVSASLEENESTPTDIVRHVFEEIKSMDTEKINIDLEKMELERLDTELINDKNEDDIKFYESSKKIIKKAQNIEYKINNEIINEDNAIIDITVKGINLDELISKFYNQLLLDGLIDEENHDEYEKVLINLVDKIEYKEVTGKIELVKNKTKWNIIDKNDITKLVFIM